jgi:hypothetical protein
MDIDAYCQKNIITLKILFYPEYLRAISNGEAVRVLK